MDAAVILSVIALGLCMAGLRLWPRLRGVSGHDGKEMATSAVSVIIPARNEAHNLPRLLSSLTNQEKTPLEILVVDDDSADGTAQVAAEMGARVVRPGALPEGWRGKPWACHQGAMAARGDVFCFLDADTWLADAQSWGRLREAAGGRVFSLCPWHEVRRPYEMLSLFFNLNMVMGTAPDGLFGQALWIHRDAYAQAGGHKRVARRVLENHALAAHCRELGMSVGSAAGRGILSFRMYPDGVGGLIEGWSKGFAAGAGATPGGVMAWIVMWLSGLMMAFVSLLVFPTSPWTWAVYAVAAVMVGVFARRVGSFPWWLAPIFPVPLMFFFGLFAWAKRISGKVVTWKGREIHAD